MERLDDLLNNDLKIIQSKDIFAFSMDAVLLAHFTTIPKKGKIIDLCTGTGVIPLLMSTKTKTEIYGVEIQEKLVDMANRSVQINHLEGQIRIHHGDLKEAPRYFGKETFDLVTVNPPYMPINGQDHNINEHFAIARHEITTNLKAVINTSAQLLKTGGRLAMVHRPSRLGDIITTLREEKLEPKRIRFVHPSLQKEANMVLVEATKFGGKELHILPPLIVYAEDGKYEKEIQQIYFGDGK
ncbi:tRNA1(Val) (adenine(37)-N6)-methyltransferase [Tepidibacillus infernus]|uniref:tRNA1(Val) (adenine(37)-N6)-methyltransferase n=1 Tax=Tepidibacillus infernus TaxID=1806172 RepID=UPI003B72A48F